MVKSTSLWAAATTAVFLCAAFTTNGAAQSLQQANEPASSGSAVFSTYCATCHGATGKGDGPFAQSLRGAPADLTMIARNNGGVYSRADVARIIDGLKPLKGHGGKDMPIWGDAFARSADGPGSMAMKIEELVTYIESIQVK